MNTAAVDAQVLQDRNAHAKPVTLSGETDVIGQAGATYGFHPKKHLGERIADVELTELASKIAIVEGAQLIYTSSTDVYGACRSAFRLQTDYDINGHL
jgi:hypothetical protein